MAAEQVQRQNVFFEEYSELTWTQHICAADDTYEDVAIIQNTVDDYVLLIRANGDDATVRFTWPVELAAEHVEPIAIANGKIYKWGPVGPRFGSKVTIEGKLATVSGNTIDFALVKLDWFRGTGIG